MAFYTRNNHLNNYPIHFAIFNALASFQRYVSKSISRKLHIFVIVYLYDILV